MKKMKFNLLLWCFLISPGSQLFSQKIDGVYFGYIVSERNALILKSSESSLTGTVYLNKMETCIFAGTILNNLLTGTVRLANGKEIVLEGELVNNSLIVKLSSNGIPSKKEFLNKISSSAKYNINKLFTEKQDPMLFGRWETIKETDSNGISIKDGKVVLEFDGSGIEYVQIINLPDKLKEIGASLNYNPHKRIEMRWTTDGSKLHSTMKLPQGEKSDYGFYVVKSDTLSIYATNGAVTIYKKK
ncbi:MAG: hypothetical protein JSS79_10295 [Bacteroidetes bacterium]|nr:hypothetical protein [Bacteroidota bacterium]